MVHPMTSRSKRWATACGVAGVGFLGWIVWLGQSGGPSGRTDAAEADPAPFLDVALSVARPRLPEAEEVLAAANVEAALQLNGGLPGTLAPATTRTTPACNLSVGGLDREDFGARLQAAASECTSGVIFVPRSVGLGVRWPDQRRLTLDDPALDPIFESEGRLVVLQGVPPEAEFSVDGAPREGWPTRETALAELLTRVRRSTYPLWVQVHTPADGARLAEELESHPHLSLVTADDMDLAAAHPDRVLFGSGLSLEVRGWRAPGLEPDESFDAIAYYGAIRDRWTRSELPDATVAAVLGGTAATLLPGLRAAADPP